jgi:hypothetical protein
VIRREFVKLMLASIVAPQTITRGLGTHDAPPQEYGNFYCWSDKPTNAEIRRVVREYFVPQIRELPLRYPFRREHLVYIMKSPNLINRSWSVGWKYKEKP